MKYEWDICDVSLGKAYFLSMQSNFCKLDRIDISGHQLAEHWPLRSTYPHKFTCQMNKSLTKGKRESKVMFCGRSGDLWRRCLPFSFVRVTFKGFLGANTIWLSSAWSEMVEEKRQERRRTDTAVKERPAGGMFRDERKRRAWLNIPLARTAGE